MKNKDKEPQKVVLVILEGWGVAPQSKGNAISVAKTPNFDNLIKTYPVGVLRASGEAVGLVKSQASSAVVGHLNIGAGRVIRRGISEIDQAISDGSFFNNKILIKAVASGLRTRSNLHIIGHLSGKNYNQLRAILQLLQGQKVSDAYFHIILGGGGSYNDGLNLVAEFENELDDAGVGKILTVSGQDYTMDLDSHWDMIEKSYQAIVLGQSEEVYSSASEAIKASYDNQIFDSEIKIQLYWLVVRQKE